MRTATPSSQALAAAITRAASKQTYYTILLFVDRQQVSNALRAYAYFRWMDDQLDLGTTSRDARIEFLNRQMALVENGYRREWSSDLSAEEVMLRDLIQSDHEKESGLRSYIHNMMAVMAFDTYRRGQVMTQGELAEYTYLLARAVTDAIHYFIGNGCFVPKGEGRYKAVTAAHITHMLRDTLEDTTAGYYNIPREYLDSHHMAPGDVEGAACRSWVRSRVQLARANFNAAKTHLARIGNMRCRIAGWAYMARFECVLDIIEGDGYVLRPEYRQRKTFAGAVRMFGTVLSLALNQVPPSQTVPVVQVEKIQPV